MIRLLQDFLYDRRFAVLVMRSLCLFVGGEIMTGHIEWPSSYGTLLLAAAGMFPAGQTNNGSNGATTPPVSPPP